MKKLDIRALALNERFGWDNEISCDGRVIGRLLSKFESRPEAVWYNDKAKEPFTTRREAVLDIGKREFGDAEEFVLSPEG